MANSDRLSFASVQKGDHRWSYGQPQPRSFSQRQREAEEREPGNGVAFPVAICRPLTAREILIRQRVDNARLLFLFWGRCDLAGGLG